MTAEEIIALRSIFCQPGEFTVLQDGKFNYNFPDEASLGKLPQPHYSSLWNDSSLWSFSK